MEPPRKELNPADNYMSEPRCRYFPIWALRCVMDRIYVSYQNLQIKILIPNDGIKKEVVWEVIKF